MKMYAGLLDSLIRDLHDGTATGLTVSRDRFTAHKRLSNEGLYFLTTSLPSLGKCFDLALETGRFFPPPGFSTQKGTNLPRFFHDKFKRVFDSNGFLLDQPDAYSIQEIRQLCFCFYKLQTSFTEDQERSSLDAFKSAESDLSDFSFGECDIRIVTRAQQLLTRVLRGHDPKDIIPGHGPGSVNTGERGNEKWAFKRIYKSAHECYPFYDYFMSSYRGELIDRIRWYRELKKEDFSLSKVCLVPKDSRGPRVISVEPLEIQYLQQGQMRSLVNRIERHPLTRGYVNFEDQSVNQRLALSSSVDRKYATLDLKEASDRIHVNLVRILFPEEHVRHWLSTRSVGTVLPDGNVLPFRKFAPMGSALCFPILALTVWSICRAYLDVNRAHGDVFVYGDDIIVPTEHASDIANVLESFALRVNKAKSYMVGSFRESCGVDAYKGVNVTPIRVSRPWSGKSTDFGSYAHFVSIMERMFHRGNWRTADYIRRHCSSLYGKIPYGLENSGFPCITVRDPSLAENLNSQCGIKSRINPDLQRREFKVLVFKEKNSNSPIAGWPRLLKGMVSPSRSDPSIVVLRQARKTLAWRWRAI